MPQKRPVRSAGKLGIVLCAVVALTGVPASAQNSTSITGGPVSGATAINTAAGNFNQQANVGVVADSAAAASAGSVAQHLGQPIADSDRAEATIAPDSFAGSSGWLAVSGASGNGNQQANLTAFGFGIEAGAAADTALSQTRASTGPAVGARPPENAPDRAVAIGEGAFAGSSGVVQVSLIGGDRNSSANSFAMSVSGPAGQ